MLKDGETGKQSIQVTIRVRPPSDKELGEDPRTCVRVEKESHSLVLSALGTDPKAFTFDSICDAENTQQDIFVRVGVGSTERCLQGYNCCIFAYGQTGAGKTFTMMGINYEDAAYFEKRGLIPRTLEYLFECIDKEVVELRSEYLVKCTFLEIYNEQIIDLLNKSNSNLQLREDLKKGVYVEGLSEETVSRSEEAMEILRRGSKGRHVGSTCYNETSSRSHSVFSMLIESKAVKNGIVNVKTRRFHFIDLAGSERTKQSNGERLKQGCSINKSLHVLGMVINSLVESTEGKTRHVNYRDSKLTFLLKDALGGNSKTHLIANISPNLISCQETLSTLTFARRVKLIKLNKVSINEDASGNLESLKCEIRRLKQEIVQLKSGHTREITMEASHQLSVEDQPESREISNVLMKNQSKLGLEKILQEYIQESIERDTKFELELARRDQKTAWLKDALQQYSKNQAHLRMIISLYEEKFKRLKFLEGKLNKRMDELTATERDQIVGHLGVEKELLARELQHYKELLGETPFIKSLMKNVGTADDSKQDDTVSAQLASNLNFLKELKGQLDQTIKERQELNSLIENYSMNKEEEMSPKKRKAIEREFQIKEQEYRDKLEQLELETAFLKGSVDETEILLKESVEREMTLEDKVKAQESQLEKLEAEVTSIEEKQQHRLAALIKEKEDNERDFEQRTTTYSLQQLQLRKTVEKHLDSLAQAQKKHKRQDEAIQQFIRDVAQMQLRNDLMEKTVRDVEDKARVDREAVVLREETILRLSGMLEEVKAERDQAIVQAEVERQAKKAATQDLQAERGVLSSRYNQRIESLNEEADRLRTHESDLLKQLSELKIENENKSQRIQSWEQKHLVVSQQLEAERVQLRKREDELKELLQKKATTDSELQTQVNELCLQSMSMSEQLKESAQKMEQLRESLYSAEEKLFEAESEREAKIADIDRLNEQFELLRQKERSTLKAKEELDNSLETQKHYLKEEQDKSRRAQLEVDRLKQREKELQQSCETLRSEVESSEHRLRESVSAGTRISDQLRELTEEFEKKEKTLEKLRESHEREIAEIREQLDSQKEKTLSHEAYMKKVFDDCLANKDKIAADLKSQNGVLTAQLTEETRKNEEYRAKLRDSEARLKELSEMVAEKDQSIIEVNDQLLLLRDEIERMKNIFEQKMEERENSYNQFIDKKNEQIDKHEVQVKKLAALLEETKAALEGETLFGQQKSQSIQELTEQVAGLEAALQKIATSMHLSAEKALDNVEGLVETVLLREQQRQKQEQSSSSTVGQLTQTVQALQQELGTSGGELKRQRDRVKQLEAELTTMVQQNAVVINSLQQDIDKEKSSKSQLSGELSHTIGMLNTELSNEKLRFEAIEQRNTKRTAELEKQLSIVEEQASVEGARAKELAAKMVEMKEQLEATKFELETVQSQFNESEVKVRELTDALDEKELLFTKNKNTLSHRIRELEYELQTVQRSLEDEVKLKEASRGSDGEKERVFNVRIDKLKADNEELRSQTTSLYTQLSELQAKLNKLEVREIHLAKLNSELESEKRQLNSRVAQLSESAKEKQGLLDTLEKEKDRANAFAEVVHEYKEKLQKQMKETEQLQLRLNNERFEEMKRLKAEFLNEVHKSNNMNERLETENHRLREENQRVYQNVQHLQQSSTSERDDLRQHVSVLEQECDNLREQLASASEKVDQLQHQASLAVQLQSSLRQERISTTNLKKLIDNLERQKIQLEAELEDKDESQKRLLAKMTKVDQVQPKLLEDRKNILKTNDLLERSRMELLQYKKTVEENNRVFKKLKAEMQAKEENFVQMHEKAEEFCRNQEMKVASIRADYEKLENEHQLLIRQKERLESLREDNENLQEELGSYKAYQAKADRRLQELQQTVQSLSAECAQLREELEGYRREPTRVGSTDNNADAKLQYINKLKEENSLIKREKQILSDRLNQECEEKLRLKAQLGHHEKKLTKDLQNRTSLSILDSMSNNVEVTLKIELEKKLGEIKYLQEGYAELCGLLGIKRFPDGKQKGGDSTLGLIISQVQAQVQELAELKSRLRDKEKELDSKNVHYEVINKEYNHLKLKILEAKGVKQDYQKKPNTAKTENTFTSYRQSFNDYSHQAAELSTFEELKQQQQLRNREGSRNRKPY